MNDFPLPEALQPPTKEKLLSWGRLCTLFENKHVAARHPDWVDVLKTCAVFNFHGIPYEDLHEAANISPDAKELMAPLPFPQIAICHDWQVLVVDSFCISESTNTVGAHMMCLMCPYPEHKEVYEILFSGYVEVNLNDDAQQLEDGAIFDNPVHTSLLKGRPTALPPEELDNYDVYPLLKPGEPDPCGDAKKLLPGMMLNLIVFLAYINNPQQYIVSQSPKKMGKVKKGAIPRLYQRPQYIVLDKQSIQTRYLDSQPSGRKSPMPHLRRGHYRTLTSERFKAKQGQRVWVRATDVKGNEVRWREGDRFYKVI